MSIGQLLTVESKHVMHVPSLTVSVDTRVYKEHIAAHASKGTQSTKTSRATSNNNGIIVSLRLRLGDRSSSGQE